jgi:hypothetical protein
MVASQPLHVYCEAEPAKGFYPEKISLCALRLSPLQGEINGCFATITRLLREGVFMFNLAHKVLSFYSDSKQQRLLRNIVLPINAVILTGAIFLGAGMLWGAGMALFSLPLSLYPIGRDIYNEKSYLLSAKKQEEMQKKTGSFKILRTIGSVQTAASRLAELSEELCDKDYRILVWAAAYDIGIAKKSILQEMDAKAHLHLESLGNDAIKNKIR